MLNLRDTLSNLWFKIDRYIDRKIVRVNKLKTLAGFDDIRVSMGVRALDADGLKRILTLFQYMSEEYDPQILVSRPYGTDVPFNAPMPDIEQSYSELRALRIILEKKEMIPPYTRGSWETNLSQYFIDAKGRYILHQQLRDYFAEVIRFCNVLLELQMAADENAEYHMNQLTNLVHLHAQFGLVLRDNYVEFLTRDIR